MRNIEFGLWAEMSPKFVSVKFKQLHSFEVLLIRISVHLGYKITKYCIADIFSRVSG
jgi:hypothetical protein